MPTYNLLVINSSGKPVRTPVTFASSVWTQATPTGTVDGANKDFVLPTTPFSAGSTIVFLDNFIAPSSEWSINLGTKTITFVTAPALSQTVYVVYLEA